MLQVCYHVFSVCFKSMFQVYDMFQICFKYGYVYFKILPSYDNGNESSQLKVCFINICLHVFSSCFEVALKTLCSMFRAHFSLV